MRQYPIRGASASELVASVERGILQGALEPGARLPTVRALAATLELSPATVAAAFRTLRLRGLVAGDGRQGTRVSPRPPLATRPALALPAGVRNLMRGNPDPALLPDLAARLRELRPALRLYGGAPNHPALARTAARLFEADGIPAAHLAVVGGALDGIDRVLMAHLRAGDRLAVEDPGYIEVFDLARALGLILHPVAIDESGPQPAALARALKAGVKALVLTPRAQNPTGAVIDRERAGELRALLRRYPDVLIVEDDHAGAIAGAGAVTLCGSGRARWAVVRSVSKALGPDLRVAMVAGDELTVGRIEGRRSLGTGWVSHILQQLVAELLEDLGTIALLERAAQIYARRRQGLLDELALWGIPATGRSGLNVWIPVPTEAAVVQAMLSIGWAVTAGERYRLASPPAVRVTIATLETDDRQYFSVNLATTLQAYDSARGA